MPIIYMALPDVTLLSVVEVVLVIMVEEELIVAVDVTKTCSLFVDIFDPRDISKSSFFTAIDSSITFAAAVKMISAETSLIFSSSVQVKTERLRIVFSNTATVVNSGASDISSRFYY